MEAKASFITRALLLCGAVSGPLFIAAVLVQSLTVPGFDIRVDLISLLSLGSYGFVQIANFTLCGVLSLVYAIGLFRTLRGGPSGILAPVFIALHGLLLVVVGVFVTDPANGFPAGSVAPATPSFHGIIHAGGALWVFVTCAAALAVLVRHFLAGREPRWAAYCAASSVLMLAIFFGSFTVRAGAAALLDVSLVIGWMGLSVVALKLLAEPAVVRRPAPAPTGVRAEMESGPGSSLGPWVLLAVVVVAAPILAGAWFGLCPEYGNPGCPGGSPAAAIGAYRVAPASLLQVFLAVNLVMPYVYPLSYLALGLAVLPRSPVLASLGMLAGWVGSVPFGSFADQSGLLSAMARLHSDTQYAALITEYMRDPHLLAVATGWVIGHLLGYVLLGAALLRSDRLPRWTGALLIVAALAMGPLAYGTGVNALQVGGYLAVAVASVPVSRSLLVERQRLPEGLRGARAACQISDQ